MPLNDPHLQFQKWAKEYGPVFSLILGTKVMIVLSTDQAVKDLMDKKSAIYSSRPDLYISQTIMSGGQRMLITVCDTREFSTQILTDILAIRTNVSVGKYPHPGHGL
jgi:hypothetical protein